MSAPMVVNTRDGSCWTRRTVLKDGTALYALADICQCPELVMATQAELADIGIVGSADALPMPVGSSVPVLPETALDTVREILLAHYDGLPRKEMAVGLLLTNLRDELLPVAPVSEAALDVAADELSAELRMRLALASAQRGRREARARVAELEAARREFPLFYLADYEGAGLTLHLTREAARDACDDFALAEARGRCWDWRAEEGVDFQFWTDPDNDRPIGDTGGAVWEVRVEDSSGPKTYPPVLPWARLMDHEDLTEFIDELAASAATYSPAEVALAEVEKTCGTWRLIAEAQHAHNTAPGPDAEAGEPS